MNAEITAPRHTQAFVQRTSSHFTAPFYCFESSDLEVRLHQQINGKTLLRLILLPPAFDFWIIFSARFHYWRVKFYFISKAFNQELISFSFLLSPSSAEHLHKCFRGIKDIKCSLVGSIDFRHEKARIGCRLRWRCSRFEKMNINWILHTSLLLLGGRKIRIHVVCSCFSIRSNKKRLR